jgi:hypothetical protein
MLAPQGTISLSLLQQYWHLAATDVRDGMSAFGESGRRWTAAGTMEAAKGFRRSKAYKHLPVLRAALAAHQSKYVIQRVEHDTRAA